MVVPPKLAIGDGALGFWAALEEVFPPRGNSSCWVHKTANVLNYLLKSAQSESQSGVARDRDGRDQPHGADMGVHDHRVEASPPCATGPIARKDV